MINIKPIAQKTGYDCGQAVAKAIIYHYGMRWPRNETPGWPCPIDGTDPRTLEAFFRAMNLYVTAGEMSLADLKHHGKMGRCVVCLIRAHDVGHWVISCGIQRRAVYVCDPNIGKVKRHDPGSFLQSWNDTARDGTSYRQWGIAVWKATLPSNVLAVPSWV